MTPKETVTKFAEASDAFPAIISQLIVKDLVDLTKILYTYLLKIKHDRENRTHSFVGIISDKANYVDLFG